MILLPDPNTGVIDPFPTAQDTQRQLLRPRPITLEPYSRDPRYIAKKAEDHLVSTGLADTAYFGPEASSSSSTRALPLRPAFRVALRSTRSRRRGNTAKDEGPTSATRFVTRRATSRRRPRNKYQDLRSEMIPTMERPGIEIRCSTTRSARGQARSTCASGTLLRMATSSCSTSTSSRNVAHAAGKTATFMPSRFVPDTVRACHVHQSLVARRRAAVLRGGPAYRGVSPTWRGGHLSASSPTPRRFLAFAAPTTNSLQATGAGLRGAGSPAYSQRNRSASVAAFPLYSKSPKAKAARVPVPRSVVQPLPRVLGDVDGRSRRHH